jgi:hypothetical protein
LHGVHTITFEEGNIVRVVASGKLTGKDYADLIPQWEKTIARHGSMRMIFMMENFTGWEPGAAWDDFHFAIEHADEIERAAFVGEKTWQKWMLKLGSVFMPEDVKYFDSSQLAEAEQWIRET